MNTRKENILNTLDGFVNQRPGVDPRDYGGGMDGWRAYRRESASITKDLHDYRAIRGQIAWRDSITADAILKASVHAFSGRLAIKEKDNKSKGFVAISYCAGQYMPTEYRKAACAVLASAWWDTTREDCPDFPVDEQGNHTGSNPGEWMRDQAKRTFGHNLQKGYFG